MNSPQGSLWRKWDLQVHTPFSYLNNEFGSDFDLYVQTLFKSAIKNQVAVIGITDYFCIEGYKKIKQEYLANDTKLQQLFSPQELHVLPHITLLPNIEFRLNTLIDGNRVNFHVIFSDAVSIQDIEENFLHELDFVYEATPQEHDERRKLKLPNIKRLGQRLKQEHPSFQSDDDLFVGMKCAVVDHTQVTDILRNKKSIFEAKYLLCVPSDEDLSELSWDGQGHNIRKVMIQKSDALVSANANTIAWALGKKHETQKKFIEEFKSLKPCIWGSDSHSFTTLFEPTEKRYTWVKADPTFDGLKQVLYEPSERIKIQESNPSYEYNKPYFRALTITNPTPIFENEEDQVYFQETNLFLNKDLVAVIGGRGMGKSMLVDYCAHIFHNHRATSLPYTRSAAFTLSYAKDNLQTPTVETYSGDKDNYLDFIYIPQRRLKDVSEKQTLSDHVKKLLKLDNLSFSLELDARIQSTLHKITELKAWFDKEDENGSKINNEQFVTAIKKQAQEFLKSITTEQNKQKLTVYTQNINDIRELETRIQSLIDFTRHLENTATSTNDMINEINETLKTYSNHREIPRTDFSAQLTSVKHNKQILEQERQEKQQQNASIKSEFEKDGFVGDLSSLLENAEAYQTQIKWAHRQLELIDKKKLEFANALTVRDSLGEEIAKEYRRQKNEIDDAWLHILEKHGGVNKQLIETILLKDGKISVDGEIVFDVDAFYQQLHNVVDRRTFRDVKVLKEKLKIASFQDWVSFVSTKLKSCIDGLENGIPNGFEELFFDIRKRSTYLRSVPRIMYNGKGLDRLSVGQRGTVYLCLKLATDAFSKPIVFDQPEDDLDNEFIMNELIDIFRELKKYRQIIIVTHNANLVVNADAEQVVIATNNEEKLSYQSGALENPIIIESVCTVLEGGREAFEKRRNKYRV